MTPELYEPMGPEAPNGHLPAFIPRGIEATLERLRDELREGADVLAYVVFATNEPVRVTHIYDVPTIRTADGMERDIQEFMWFEVNGQRYHV